mmetsp:Transcript_52535/g.94255  ORF Transcript_52535/g.94255 Transcript_52535/m.94255 type:complete len:214 (+) Transcript_52535:403-1044(+)
MQTPCSTASPNQGHETFQAKLPVLNGDLLPWVCCSIRRWVIGHVTEEAKECLSVRCQLHSEKHALHLGDVHTAEGVALHGAEPSSDSMAVVVREILAELVEALATSQVAEALDEAELNFNMLTHQGHSLVLDVTRSEGRFDSGKSGASVLGKAKPEHERYNHVSVDGANLAIGVHEFNDSVQIRLELLVSRIYHEGRSSLLRCCSARAVAVLG